MGKWIGGVAAMVMAALIFAAPAHAQGKSIDFTKEPSCDSLTPTSMGGPAPKSPRLLVVRYLGSSNHEIAYRNTVLLLNAHYARTPPARPLGFTRDDVKKVDALLIGHGHGDHMSDAPYVAMKTGAPLVGAPITTTQAQKMGLVRSIRERSALPEICAELMAQYAADFELFEQRIAAAVQYPKPKARPL